MINIQVATESERILVKLINQIIEAGYLYQADVDKICIGLTDNERNGVLKKFAFQPFVKFKEGIYEYKDVVYDTVIEEEIFKSIIKPDYINITKNFAQVGNYFFYGIFTEALPPTTYINWLYQLAGEKGNVDYAIHIHPTNTATELKDMQTEMRHVMLDIYEAEKKGGRPDLVQKLNEIKQKIQELSSAQYKLCNVDMYFTAKATTTEKAETLAKQLKSNLSSASIDIQFAKNYQQPLIKSIVPLGTNFFKAREFSIGTDALAESDPYSYPWLDIDEKDGVLIGWNDNGLPVAKSLWKLPSYSGIVIGPTGRGKSFTAKAFLDQENMVNGTRIIIIDPAASKFMEPEYKRMCEIKKGAYISFSTTSKNIPNINCLRGDTYQDAIIDVVSLYNILLGDSQTGTVTDAQKPIIEEVITKMYEHAGITEDPSTWHRAPTMDALTSILKKMLDSAESQKTKESIEALLKRVKRFVGNGIYNFINTKGADLSIDNNFVVFAFQDTPEEIKPVLTGIVMNYIRDKAGRELRRTIIVIDEAHIWLRNPVLAAYIQRMVKTLRKSNTGLLLIFQDITDLENCKEGLGVLSNIEFKYIMGCKPNSLKILGEKLDMNTIELNYLATADKGSGLLIWGNDHYRVNIKVDEETYKVITTNPEDIKKFKDEEKTKGVFDDRTANFLMEDLQHVPATIEESAKQIAEKISKGQLDLTIINHYHNPLDVMIRDNLRAMGVDPHAHIKGVSEKVLDAIAHRVQKKLLGKHGRKGAVQTKKSSRK